MSVREGWLSNNVISDAFVQIPFVELYCIVSALLGFKAEMIRSHQDGYLLVPVAYIN
jgi:hypothetical protein